MTYLIDTPTPFSPLAEWEEFLKSMESINDDPLPYEVKSSITEAKIWIAMKSKQTSSTVNQWPSQLAQKTFGAALIKAGQETDDEDWVKLGQAHIATAAATHDDARVTEPSTSPDAQTSSSHNERILQMNAKQRKILIWLAAVLVAMLLFPPFHYLGSGQREAFAGYRFILSSYDAAAIDRRLLIIELCTSLIVARIIYILTADTKPTATDKSEGA